MGLNPFDEMRDDLVETCSEVSSPAPRTYSQSEVEALLAAAIEQAAQLLQSRAEQLDKQQGLDYRSRAMELRANAKAVRSLITVPQRVARDRIVQEAVDAATKERDARLEAVRALVLSNVKHNDHLSGVSCIACKLESALDPADTGSAPDAKKEE